MLINHMNKQMYGNHFSIGRKNPNVMTRRPLVDIHYSTQDPIKGLSEKDDTKCFINDKNSISIANFRDIVCEIPRNRNITNAYNSLFLDYLLVILATPFVPQSDLEHVLRRIKSVTMPATQQLTHSPMDGGKRSKKVHIGARGGRYIIVNGMKRYIKHQ